jgi:hypothetical protein
LQPTRHIEREEIVDLSARTEELRNAVVTQLVRRGEEVVLGGAIVVGARGLSIATDEGATAIKRRVIDLTSRLRDLNDGLGSMLADERLVAIVKSAGEGHPLVVRVDSIKKLAESIEGVLEVLSFLEETPAMDVDFRRLHQTLVDLLAMAAEPLGAALAATHVTEAEFRL